MNKRKDKIMVIIGLLTIICIGSTFSSYLGTAGAVGSVDAAVWNVSITPGVSNAFRLVPDSGTVQYSFSVTNNSEVDVVYSVIISNIPSGVEAKLDNGSFQSGSTVTFTDAGTILYSAQSNSNSHVLTLRATSGAAIVNSQTVGINVEIRQII